MSALLHLRVAGVLLLMLAATHVTFPRRLGWKEDVGQLTPLNRQIFYVHCLFIVIMLVMMGVLSACFGQVLLEGRALARVVLSGLVFFWGARLFVQLFVYDRALWRGDRAKTIIHVVFTTFWSYLVFVYGYALAVMPG